MSQISRKKPIKRKRQSGTFHIQEKKQALPEKASFLKKVGGGIKKIYKKATSAKAKAAAKKIVDVGVRIAENQKRMEKEGRGFGDFNRKRGFKFGDFSRKKSFKTGFEK